MGDNENKSYDYNELKESHMIVMEVRNFVVLNDERILYKNEEGKWVDAPEDNEFVQEIRTLLNQRKNLNETRRIDTYLTQDDELEP